MIHELLYINISIEIFQVLIKYTLSETFPTALSDGISHSDSLTKLPVGVCDAMFN